MNNDKLNELFEKINIFDFSTFIEYIKSEEFFENVTNKVKQEIDNNSKK